MSNNISTNFAGFDNLDDPARLNTMLLTTTFGGVNGTSAFPGVFEQGTIVVNVQNTTAIPTGSGDVSLQYVPEDGGVTAATTVCTFADAAAIGDGPVTFTTFQVKLSTGTGNFYFRLSCAGGEGTAVPVEGTQVSLAITYSNSH
jgi:hypothetical protein